MFSFKDLYPEFAGTSTNEKSVPEAPDQQTLGRFDDARGGVELTKKTSFSYLGIFLVIVILLIVFGKI